MASCLFPNVAAKVSTSTEIWSCNKHMPLSFTIFNLKHFRCFSELWIQGDGDFSIDGHLDCSLSWNTRELQHPIEVSPNNSASDIYEMPQKSKLPPNFSDISQDSSQYQKYFYRGLRRAFVFCQSVKTHYTQVPKEATPSTGIILNYYSPKQLGDH